MDVLQFLKIVAAVLTIVTGLVSLLRPRSVMGFTGLIVPGARGITEIRAVLGGTFIGLGLAPLLLGAQAAYQTLGITYLAIFATRVIGVIVDRSAEPSNWISMATEIVMGVVLIV
jgi:hypothetical protein